MKKITFLISVILLLALSGCAKNTQQPTPIKKNNPDKDESKIIEFVLEHGIYDFEDNAYTVSLKFDEKIIMYHTSIKYYCEDKSLKFIDCAFNDNSNYSTVVDYEYGEEKQNVTVFARGKDGSVYSATGIVGKLSSATAGVSVSSFEASPFPHGMSQDIFENRVSEMVGHSKSIVDVCLYEG